jgi:hypothetical protein
VQIGIGDQSTTSLSDPRFAALGIKAARIVLPWDIAQADPARLGTWVEEAESRGIEPFVALGKASSDRCPGSPCVLPSDAQYRTAFDQLHQLFPSIRVFTAWNEPNHAREPTAHDPAAAAHYADIVAEECPDCTVVAADVLDGPGMGAYLSFYRAALTSNPSVWGLHNYYDTTYFQTSGTDSFLAAVDGRVWLSESGGIVTWRTSDGQVQLPYDEQRAASSLRFGLALAAEHADRIDRIYVYQWRASPVDDFDAGLVAPDGSERPALGVLRSALGLLPTSTTGSGDGAGGNQPPASGLLVAPPNGPQARVTVGSVRVGRGGSVAVVLRCAGAGKRCRGRLTLSGTGRIAERYVNGRPLRGTLVPRRRAFDLRAGGRVVIRLRLPRAVLARAARNRAGLKLSVVPRVAGDFTAVHRAVRFPRSLQPRT